MRCLAAAFAVFLTSPVSALDVSALVRDRGLAAAETELAGATAVNDRFALAGVIFLGAIEQAWQTRWRYGMTFSSPFAPGALTDLPANPAPERLPADIFNRIALNLIDDMDRAAAVLGSLPEGADPGFSIKVSDLWFDVNGSGTRDPGEEFSALALSTLLSPWDVAAMREAAAADPEAASLLTATIRFDAADADWLLAYTHLARGASEVVLAFDPEPEIARALDLRDALAAHPADPGATTEQWMWGKDTMIDIAAVIINTLAHQPDPARIASARAHFLDMVGLSRSFWQKVALETDNDAEWIPNATQTAALGFSVPPETGPAWLAVLDDAEKLLTGDLLMPHWRFNRSRTGAADGINLGRWLDAPEPVRVIDWIQGTAALPFAEKGQVMTDRSWFRFSELVAGRGMLFAVLLN